jgi:hypothetical protein
MSRKHVRRRVVIPLPPRGLRPKLAPDQVSDLALAHLVNLDLIAHGQADETVLWQTVEGVLTWSRAADLTGAGQDEMQAQLQLCTQLLERYAETGRIGFTGAQYQLAKRGVEVMDQLAELVDKHTAVEAVVWSERQTERMLGEYQARAGAELRGRPAMGGPAPTHCCEPGSEARK